MGIKSFLKKFFSPELPIDNKKLYIFAEKIGIVDVEGFKKILAKYNKKEEKLEKIILFLKEKPKEKVLELLEKEIKDKIKIVYTDNPREEAYKNSKIAIYIEDVVSRDLTRDPC
jgi:hypothetical protein